MDSRIKISICFILALLEVSILSPFLKFIGLVLGLIAFTALSYVFVSWIAVKFNWKWWIN